MFDRLKPAKPPRGLTGDQIKLVNALAAYQLRYGQAEEAMVLAQLAHWYSKRDRQPLMLMARALAALRDWRNADLLVRAAEKFDAAQQRPQRDVLFAAIVAAAASGLDRGKARLRQILGAAA